MEARQLQPFVAEPQLAEKHAGALSHTREMAVNVWGAVSRHPKEVLAIGAASFACAQAAELSINAEPGMANGIPASKCVKLPKISSAQLFLNHGTTESFSSTEWFPALREDQCDGIRRLAQRKLQVKQGRRWVTITRNPSWTPFMDAGAGYGGDVHTAAQSREAQKTGLNLTLDARNEPKKFMAGCHSKAREKIRVRAQDSSNGNVVAQNVMTHPFNILKRRSVCKKH